MHQDLLEERAKEQLNTLSLHDHLRNWEDQMNRPTTSHLKAITLTARKKEKSFRINSQGISRGNIKTPLVPNKVKFEDRPERQLSFIKNKSVKDARKKYSNRVLSVSNQIEDQKALDKKEMQNIDLMKFWFRNRLKQNSINCLINRIQQKRRSIRQKNY